MNARTYFNHFKTPQIFCDPLENHWTKPQNYLDGIFQGIKWYMFTV